jgi:hypothetical protein
MKSPLQLGTVYWLSTDRNDIVEGPFASYLHATTRRLELTDGNPRKMNIMFARISFDFAEIIGQTIWTYQKDKKDWKTEKFIEPQTAEEGQERMKTETEENIETTEILWTLIQPEILKGQGEKSGD